MKAVNTSEPSLTYETAQSNIPERCRLHALHRKNLKYHSVRISYSNKCCAEMDEHCLLGSAENCVKACVNFGASEL